MDYLFGLKTKDFVLMAADKSQFRSIFRLTGNLDKSHQIGENMLMCCAGEGGDAVQFSQYIAKNIQLYRMRNGYDLSPKATASFTRKTIAESLRSRDPYMVHLIFGGYDKLDGPYLTMMDYLGTQFDGPFIFHGHGGKFCYGILDRVYREDLTEAQAVEVLKMCVREINTRFLVNMPEFKVWTISKDGIKELPDIAVVKKCEI